MDTASCDGVFTFNRKRLSAQSNAKIQRKTRRVFILGSTKSGKSSLVKRFIHDTFTDTYIPTIEECYNLDYVYKGYNLNLDIIDTCGVFMFPVMRDLNIKKADIVIATYEINNDVSIKEAIASCKKVNEIRKDVIPVVLVGCKSDLNDEKTECQDTIVGELGGLKFKHLITSAKLNMNVKDAFELGFDDIIKIIPKKSLTSIEHFVKKREEKKRINFCVIY